MAGVKRFEELEIWKEARVLNKELFLLFSDHKNFAFRDQLLRASLSVLNNIAEGFERDSDKEFQRFLKIAKGSAGEVRNMFYIANDLNYLSNDQAEVFIEKIAKISSGISKLIKYLNKN
ncbi:MAG: four helix bundle protein [Bacteroidales bacterium]|nr:four helix bundle protein [Bacteroidales bacterium]